MVISEFNQMLRMLIFIITLVTVVVAVMLTNVEIHTSEIERISFEIADNLLNSEIVIEEAVFNITQLNMFDNRNIEPYARNCKYAYNVLIEDHITGKKWNFGYENLLEGIDIKAPQISTYAVAINDGSIHPASMILTVYHNWFTEITCMVEKSWQKKIISNLTFPCTMATSNYGCTFPIRQHDEDPNSICIFKRNVVSNEFEYLECRNMPGIQLNDFYFIYGLGGDDGQAIKKLKAIPIVKDKKNEIRDLTIFNPVKMNYDNEKGLIEACQRVSNNPDEYQVINQQGTIGSVLLCVSDVL